MKFDDEKIASEKNFAQMQNKYIKILNDEVYDLREILDKMKFQKESLEKENIGGMHNEILDKFASNIAELENLITGTINSSARHLSPILPNMQFLHTRALANEPNNDAISPIRSSDEISEHSRIANPEEISPVPNSDNTVPPIEENISSDLTPTAPQTNTQTKRNSPMQGNIIFNLAKSFEMIFGHKKTVQKKCESRNIFLGSQKDIIRLLLLYMMLHPNCRFISRLAFIANEQFDIMLSLEY